jgi:ABC-type protease/lipase transport system fused ATPase/permease subunit
MRGFLAANSSGATRALLSVLSMVSSAPPAALRRIGWCTVLLNVLGIAGAILGKHLCDIFAYGDNPARVTLTSVTIALVCCVAVLATRARGATLTSAVDAMEERSSIALARRGRTTITAWQSPTAALGSDVDAMRQFADSPVMAAAIDLPFAPVLAICILLINPWLALIGLLSFAGGALLLLRAYQAATPPGTARAADVTGLADALVRYADCARTMNLTPMLTARWQFLRRAADTDRRATAPPAWLGISASFLSYLCEIAIVIAAAILTRNGAVTLGAVLASCILLHLAMTPIRRVMAGWQAVLATGAACLRVGELTAYAAAQTVTLPPPIGELVLDNVDWTPQGAPRPALRGVTLKIEAGAFLAIIGPSAAGKSTLARVLCGAVQPGHGSVTLDGTDLARWSDVQLGEAIGYLPQDISLFPGTIAENIARFGNASRMQIVAAATRAGVHEMILQLPAGYTTLVDERLATLSAGQKQRIALARALLGDPPVLVLDEPDSSLDAEGEAALIHCMIEARRRRRTVVIITHNTGLVRVADFVATMVGGHVMKVQRTAEMLGRPAILAATG